MVHLSYALASSYVGMHAASRGYKAQAKQLSITQQQQQQHNRQQHYHLQTPSPRVAVLDTLIWQGFASVVIPGLTINRLCALSRFMLNRYAVNMLSQHVRRWAVTGIGLGSIPFIIHPIDRYRPRLYMQSEVFVHKHSTDIMVKLMLSSTNFIPPKHSLASLIPQRLLILE